MTRRELNGLFARKSSLFNSRQALAALEDSLSLPGLSPEEKKRLGCNIADLRQSIQHERAEIEKQEVLARETLKKIEDDVGRIGAMLHFCEGMPWKRAAAVLHLNAKPLAQAVYRSMNAAKIPK